QHSPDNGLREAEGAPIRGTWQCRFPNASAPGLLWAISHSLYAHQSPRKSHRTGRRTQRGTRHEVDLEKAANGAQRRLAESRATCTRRRVRSALIAAQTLEPANLGLLYNESPDNDKIPVRSRTCRKSSFHTGAMTRKRLLDAFA